MLTLWVLVILGLTAAPDKQINIMTLGAYESKAACEGMLERIEKESKVTLKFARACVPVALNSGGGRPA